LELGPASHPSYPKITLFLLKSNSALGAPTLPARGKELLLCRQFLTWPIDIKIRQAELPDAPVIAEFNLLLAMETEGLRLDPECVRKGVMALLADPAKGIYYIAEIDSAIAGQLMITYEWSDWRNGNIWWIQSVYVRQEFRRKGVFRQLFRSLESLARTQKDVCGLRLYMHADNRAARRSYETLGMHRTMYEVFELVLDPASAEGLG
jgi:GNAT superfamily N-acetyltransferase